MNDFHQQIKRQLTDSAATLFPPAAPPTQVGRRARRTPVLAAVLAGALLFAAAAFAASGLSGEPEQLADDWRARYRPILDEVNRGARPWADFDELPSGRL